MPLRAHRQARRADRVRGMREKSFDLLAASRAEIRKEGATDSFYILPSANKQFENRLVMRGPRRAVNVDATRSDSASEFNQNVFVRAHNLKAALITLPSRGPYGRQIAEPSPSKSPAAQAVWSSSVIT
jgi:hypothetical protein